MCGSESWRGTFASRTVLPPAEPSASRLRVHTNTGSDTERNTYCHSYRDSNGNADTECYTNSDGYSYGDADGYTDNYTKAHTNTKTPSVTAAETVGGSLPLNDEHLLHGRNSGRKTQSM